MPNIIIQEEGRANSSLFSSSKDICSNFSSLSTPKLRFKNFILILFFRWWERWILNITSILIYRFWLIDLTNKSDLTIWSDLTAKRNAPMQPARTCSQFDLVRSDPKWNGWNGRKEWNGSNCLCMFQKAIKGLQVLLVPCSTAFVW